MKVYEEATEEKTASEEGMESNEALTVEGSSIPAPIEGAGSSSLESVDITPIVSALELIRQDQSNQYLVVAQIAQRDREISYGLLALVALLFVYVIVRDFLKG